MCFGETEKNTHGSKFSSKAQATREESDFYKHMASHHGSVQKNKSLGDLFLNKCAKSIQEAHNGTILNSKS